MIRLALNLSLTTILFICSLKERFELTLTPRSVWCTSAKFCPDWLGFAAVIPETLLCRPSKSSQYRLKHVLCTACIQAFSLQLFINQIFISNQHARSAAGERYCCGAQWQCYRQACSCPEDSIKQAYLELLLLYDVTKSYGNWKYFCAVSLNWIISHQEALVVIDQSTLITINRNVGHR